MGRHSTLTDEVKNAILHEYCCSKLTQEKVAIVVSERFGVSVSWGQVNRLCTNFKNKYGRLLKMGMPIEVVFKNRHVIDAKGIETIAQELTERLLLNAHTLYDYLNEGGNNEK